MSWVMFERLVTSTLLGLFFFDLAFAGKATSFAQHMTYWVPCFFLGDVIYRALVGIERIANRPTMVRTYPVARQHNASGTSVPEQTQPQTVWRI